MVLTMGGVDMVFYTPEQLAEFLHLEAAQIYLWLKQRRLSGIRIGQTWRISEQQFQEFIRNHTVAKSASAISIFPDSAKEGTLEITAVTTFPVVAKSSFGNASLFPTKYHNLRAFLSESTLDSIVLSFDDIERITGWPLPASAAKLRPWWANDITHSQARAWLEVGWKTDKVNFERKEVVFRKNR